jgi:hypothetical protein
MLTAVLGVLLSAALAAPALAKAPSAATLKAYEQEDRTLANELAGITASSR